MGTPNNNDLSSVDQVQLNGQLFLKNVWEIELGHIRKLNETCMSSNLYVSNDRTSLYTSSCRKLTVFCLPGTPTIELLSKIKLGIVSCISFYTMYLSSTRRYIVYLQVHYICLYGLHRFICLIIVKKKGFLHFYS